MISRLDKRRTERKYLNLFLGFIAFLLFIYYWVPFKTLAYPAVEPIVRAYSSSKIASYLVPEFVRTYVSSRSSLESRTKELEVTIERLENELANKDAQMRELSLSTEAPSGNPVVVMYPIAEDVTRLYSTILLSKGYRVGIQKGGLVYVRGQQAVCEIVEVYDTTSLCELLSKSGRSTEGVTASSSIMLILQGAGGGNFIAEVSKGTAVSQGERVYLRSDQGFILGTVVSIKEDEQDTGAKVYVRGAYNPVNSSIFYMKANNVH